MVRWTVVALLTLVAGCAGKSEPLRTDAGVSADLSAADWSQAETVDVTATEFEFGPSQLRFDREHLYHLRLQNSGGVGHSFSAPAFFASAALREDAASAELRAGGGTIELAAGQTVDVYFQPQRAGTFPLQCTHPLHSTFGMTGEIVVE
ncbi:MAG TPA: plastocyanin/azurin family copper-binding protein [Geminicoccaceae bacterium]|nr:plastocyanin/azurin family copper-binding protein [Geminicoccaceae bacterium]